VVHEPVEPLGAQPHGDLQGVQHELGAQMRGELPPDDHAAVHVDDERDVAEA